MTWPSGTGGEADEEVYCVLACVYGKLYLSILSAVEDLFHMNETYVELMHPSL